ncbi:MAG: AEC family transporter [Peptostreptococcales bacterium]
MNAIVMQLCLLFGFIALGFICNKLGLLDTVSDKYFSGFLLKITLPASIIASAIGQDTENRMTAFYVLALAAGIFIFTPFFAAVFQKIFKTDDTYKLMLTYPNLGFMGFPIMTALYGGLGSFYTSLFMIIFNLSVFSYGVSVLQKEAKLQLKKLLNPGIIAAVLAILIFNFALPVPEVITKFLDTIGSITSPLAMITLGSTLGAVSITSVLKDRMLYIMSFTKLILLPFMVWLVLQFFVKDPMILGICVILTSMPVASNVSMLCITYDGNKELAAKGTFMSTVFSLITIPVYMILFSI